MVNRKEGPKLEAGTGRVIAVTSSVYRDLDMLKEPKEPFHSVIRRLINFYRNRQ